MVKPYDVPGFFPTSARVAKIMIEAAGLKRGDRVLEPSAGNGAILAMLPSWVDVTCYEVQPRLRSILIKRGYKPRRDFLKARMPRECFDAIIMNPPFEGKDYFSHVLKAERYLKPGGRLVALIPATDRLLTNCQVVEIPAGSGNKKGSVSVKMIVTKGNVTNV